MPDGLIAIEDFAFYEQDKLRDVSIPPTVTSIGVSAFADTFIVSVTFDGVSTLEYIANYAF
jgi:hypothetical protein